MEKQIEELAQFWMNQFPKMPHAKAIAWAIVQLEED